MNGSGDERSPQQRPLDLPFDLLKLDGRDLTQEEGRALSRAIGIGPLYDEADLAARRRIKAKRRTSRKEAVSIIREEHAKRGLTLPDVAVAIHAEFLRRPLTAVYSRPVRGYLRERRREEKARRRNL